MHSVAFFRDVSMYLSTLRKGVQPSMQVNPRLNLICPPAAWLTLGGQSISDNGDGHTFYENIILYRVL